MTRLAFLAALLAYIATLSGGSYWLDGAEFTAVTVALDIAHPPGHPLNAIWGKAFTLLPLGPLPLRVAFGQALAAALGVACLQRALARLGSAAGLHARVAGPLALGGSLCVALCFGLWFQAVRPEVYALQGMLLMAAIERLSALVEQGFSDARPLYAACIAVGLGLTNHHLMAFFFFPPLAYAALRLAARRHAWASRLRPLWISACIGLASLGAYAYLPLRAARKPPANLGDPTTLERIYWVVSARVYARDMGDENPQPMAERFADVLVVLVEQLSGPLVLLALLGVYVGLRQRATRGHAALWLLVGGSVLLVRPWLGPVRGNPDSVGYLLAGLCAVAAFAVVTLASLLALWERARSGGWAARGAALALTSVLGLGQVAAHAQASNLSWFVAADAFDEARVRSLPPRSVVVATTPQTVFRQLEALVVERARADVALVPLPFLRYPGVADATVARSPELAPLVARYLETDSLDLGALRELASRRPVLVEPDTSHLAPSDYPWLVPAGLLYRVVETPVDRASYLERARERQAEYARVLRALGPTVHETETTRQLLWTHYLDAVHAAARGERDLALRSLRQGAQLHPEDAHLQAMIAALSAAGGTGPIDVTPFLRVDEPLPDVR